MALYKTNPDLGGFVHSDAAETDRKLREGDGILWQGDPKLELRMGILTAKVTGYHAQCKRNVRKGEVIARRYEVWRHTELGTDEMLGHWTLEEYDRILVDMAGMRLDSPGHVDTGSKVDANNDAVTDAAATEYAEHLGEMGEHLGKLYHDRTQPKNVFRQMPGTRDDEPSFEIKYDGTITEPGAPAVKVTDKRASAAVD